MLQLPFLQLEDIVLFVMFLISDTTNTECNTAAARFSAGFQISAGLNEVPEVRLF